MPNIGSIFGGSLPSLSGKGSVSDSVLNYNTPSANTLVSESWSKSVSTFFTNPFKKPAVDAPATPAPSTEVVATASTMNQSLQSGDSADHSISHKVRLVAATDGEINAIQDDVSFVTGPLTQYTVEFDIMPEVSEIRNLEYEAVSTPQMPTEFQKYKGTRATTWQINGSFMCRTRDEAKRNYIFMNTLRAWSMPYFGEKQRLQFGEDSRGKLGAPPPVLKFSGWRGLIGTVPVVITSLNWNWPKDCDWIPCGVFDEEGREIPFPTVMAVNIAVVESFSPDQVNGFDLVAFRNGRMVNAWLEEGAEPQIFQRSEPLNGNGGNQSTTNGTAQGVAATSGSIGGSVSTANRPGALNTAINSVNGAAGNLALIPSKIKTLIGGKGESSSTPAVISQA